MKVRELYSRSIERLRRAGIPDPQLEAELLLRFHLDLDRVAFFIEDRQLDEGQLAAFETLLGRRLDREPLAYITGEKEFWSLPFEVSPAVLIPRPETELLIERVLVAAGPPADFRGVILDLGTGSGIVPVVIALELPGAELVAVDISAPALEMAARNVDRHGVGDRVRLVRGDWFAPLEPTGRFEMIVSNPPYVPTTSGPDLQAELDFEPDQALFAGEEGLDAYRRFIPECRVHLRSGGHLLLEIGDGQERPVRDIIAATPGLKFLEAVPDLAGIGRVVAAKAVD